MTSSGSDEPLDLGFMASLRSRDARERSGLFLAEGIRFLLRASMARAPIVGLVTCPAFLENTFARRLLRRQRSAGIRAREVSAQDFRSLSRAERPSGVMTLVRQRWLPLAGTPPPRDSTWLALEHVRSAGNLGTILRTCEATGVSGVILLGDATDPHDPVCVRGSMGSIFAVRLFRASHVELRAWARGAACSVVGTSAHAMRDYRGIEYRGRVVLMMGCERRGLSPDQEDLCDKLVRIPMVGEVDSLNVAVATGVLLYEVFGRRRPAR